VRVFLDEGQPMQALLAGWLAKAGVGPAREYAIHLLSQFEAQAQGTPSPASAPTASHAVSAVEPSVQTSSTLRSGQALVEPLSGRELQVLHLIAQGRTNQEIAQQLVVARGTVKAHASHIYRKLDVANRTEAVAHARQLGILP
jgi:LuxR family maltose regulon positive regulatory protein